MSSKSLLFCGLSLLATLLSSCVAPFVPYQSNQPLAAQDPGIPQPPALSSGEQKSIKKTQKKVSQSTSSNTTVKKSTPSSTPSTSASQSTKPTTAPKPTYRYALQIPGKEGFVFNPFTNNPVDVRGIPSGTLVRDPQDSNPDHKFRVP